MQTITANTLKQPSKRPFNSIDFIPFIICLIIVLLEFYMGRGFFEDEGSLALNIANRAPHELLLPLDSVQVAPIGFLLIIKSFTYILGNIDWVYRVLPLLASLIMIGKIAQLKPSPNFNRTAFLLILILNPILLRYCIEVKQYIVDVLLAVFIITNLHLKKYVQNFLVLAAFVWLSNASFLLILPVAIFYLLKNKAVTGKYFPSLKKQKKDYFFIALCFVSMATYYLLFVKGNSTKAAMVAYWYQFEGIYQPGKNYVYFLYHCLGKICEGIKPFYDLFYMAKLTGIFVGLFVLFILSTLKSDMGKFFLILLLTHLIFSSLSLYPVDIRLVLYLLPFIIYLVSMKASALKYANRVFICIYCFIPFSFLRKPVFPFRTDESAYYIKYLNNLGYKNIYCKGGSADIAEFYKKSLKLPIQIIRLNGLNMKLDTTIPILVESYKVNDLPKESLKTYKVHDTLSNIFGAQQISDTYMFLPGIK